MSKAILYCGLALLGAAQGQRLTPQDSPKNAVMWQNMPLAALLNGYMAGNVTVGEALRNGDFGLGAFADLDGEMVAFNGKIFQIPASGKPRVRETSAVLSYAQMIEFRPEAEIPLPRGTSFDNLSRVLSRHLSGPNSGYAIRITGSFSELQARAPRTQKTPYPPFCKAISTQAVFQLDGRSGAMVGFLAPAYLSMVDSAGFHFHFLSRDYTEGGHVLTFETEHATLQYQRIQKTVIDTPSDPNFERVPLTSIIQCP